jgi:hypothetical protein
MDTNYFLTVFKKKTFGMEKIFEKRIGTLGNTLDDYTLTFDPNGEFLLFEGRLSYSYYFKFVFNLKAQFKEPLILKRGV